MTETETPPTISVPTPPDPYFAGIVDGEGHVGIMPMHTGRRADGSYKKKQHTITVAVGMCDARIPRLFQMRFGGSVYAATRKSHYKPIFTWKVYAKKAEYVLRELLPWLIVKQAQAYVALEFRDSLKKQGFLSRGPYKNQQNDAVILNIRETLNVRMKALNKRGA